MLKRILAGSVLFIMLLGMLNISGFAQVTENTVVIETADAIINVYAKAAPNAKVAVMFLKPNSGVVSDDNLDGIAYLGQVTADSAGNVEETFYIPEGTGSYTLKMSNCYDVSYDVLRVAHEIFAASWSDDFKSDYIYPFFRLSIGKVSDEINGEYVINEEKIAAAAESAKEYFRSVPEGRRVLIIWQALIHMLNDDAENYLWWDNGVEKLKPYMESFFKTFSEIGGKLDAVVTDFESGMTNWHLKPGETTYEEAHLKYKQIESDSRYVTEIKPLLAERGFVFYDNAEDVEEKGELYWVCYYNGSGTSDYHIWNKVMSNRVAEYLDEAAFDVVRKYFPECKCSNYGNGESDASYMITSDGHRTYRGGNSNHAGTHSSMSLYGRLLGTTPQYMQDSASYEKNGFTLLKYDANRAKAATLSDENGFMPWIANPDWTTSNYIGGTPYYYELILHTGLLNPDMFLYWGPRYGDEAAENVLAQAEKLNEVLQELNSMVGYPERESLADTTDSWNADYVLTGMKAGGRNVFRITPNLELGTVTKESFLTDSETPTFKISGTEITFPQGVIIENRYSNATYGYWVETPENVFPKVSYDPQYYQVTSAGFWTELNVFDTETGIIKNSLSEKGVDIRISYKNRAGDLASCVVFAAGYSQSGKVLFVDKIFEGDIAFGEDGYKIYKTGTLTGDVKTLKVFLWDGYSDITPLGGAIELSKQN